MFVQYFLYISLNLIFFLFFQNLVERKKKNLEAILITVCGLEPNYYANLSRMLRGQNWKVRKISLKLFQLYSMVSRISLPSS